jgi:hypothetical protein
MVFIFGPVGCAAGEVGGGSRGAGLAMCQGTSAAHRVRPGLYFRGVSAGQREWGVVASHVWLMRLETHMRAELMDQLRIVCKTLLRCLGWGRFAGWGSSLRG